MRQDDTNPEQVFANDNDECGCPEHVCLADAAAEAEGMMNEIFEAMEETIQDEIDAEAIHNRQEAVAQLGRILEVQSLAIERHARLVEEVLSDI